MRGITDRPTKRLELHRLRERLKISREYPIGAVRAGFGLTDIEGTLGAVEFDRRKREIRRLNVARPGIRDAATASDEKTLNYYIAELCFIATGNIRRDTGDWPWPQEGWPQFLAACDDLGRSISSPD
ncbi:MAG TPA: hypothetical protein VKB79_17425 [Bryobacteraceae bacterium]|nr:hypothetical protein [Bryobacteraceae bacterium]